MVVWGLWMDGRLLFSTGSKSRKARNLAHNPNCVVCTELANEAVIVEGIAEIADVSARRKMLPVYERKYKFDMGNMKDDILSIKEPVFAVRPRLVFGLWEKEFIGKSTRWKFESLPSVDTPLRTRSYTKENAAGFVSVPLCPLWLMFLASKFRDFQSELLRS